MTWKSYFTIELSKFRNLLIFMGYNMKDGTFGIQVYLSKLVVLSLLVNSVYSVAFYWDNEDKRADGIKTAMYSCSAFIYNTMYTSNWKNSNMLIRIIEAGPYTGPTQVPEKREELIKKIRKGMVKLNTAWWYMIMSHTVQCFTLPIVTTLVIILIKGIDKIDSDNFYLALSWYYPNDYKTFATYMLAYVVQSIVILCGTVYAYLIISSTILVMQLISGELRVLRLYIEEMENTTSRKGLMLTKESYIEDINTGGYATKNPEAMREFIRCFVKHQVDLYRKVNDITEGMGIMIVMINSLNAIFICSTIVKLVQSKKMMDKIVEFLFLGLMVFRFYCYDLVGETVATEDENVRKALYESNWIDMPQWFKRSIQIIMIRCNKPIDIRPCGIIEMNLRNTARTINAIYSYYNVLNSFKRD